jgi:hypothetical protein
MPQWRIKSIATVPQTSLPVAIGFSLREPTLSFLMIAEGFIGPRQAELSFCIAALGSAHGSV